MQSALKDITITIAALVILAYSTGHREWLWKQIAAIRHVTLAEMRQEWGCLSVFDKSARKRDH